ncbi:hypothetical protein IV203_023142 [Nitzschia inconspicua]|uniref:Uncharacterized protein n=1 Tax=Nitzschia inconspicua TaxID=303405 RepID=A0A9K3KDJ9_9STRA|nr:hypothetical protein IV203_023142 [Nitzschia inconspicua]
MSPNKRAKTTKEAAKKAAPVGKIEFEAGFFMLKAIQRVIAFRANESVVAIGDKKFMKGIEMFEGIYEDTVNDMTVQNERVLKFVLHCKEETKIISNQDPRFNGINSINIASLTCKKLTDRRLVTGRTIIDMGKEVESSGRKIQAFVSKALHAPAAGIEEASSITLPSSVAIPQEEKEEEEEATTDHSMDSAQPLP